MFIQNQRPRAVVQIGRSLYVALPVFWTMHHGINPKDKLAISMVEDGSLLMRLVKEHATH